MPPVLSQLVSPLEDRRPIRVRNLDLVGKTICLNGRTITRPTAEDRIAFIASLMCRWTALWTHGANVGTWGDARTVEGMTTTPTVDPPQITIDLRHLLGELPDWARAGVAVTCRICGRDLSLPEHSFLLLDGRVSCMKPHVKQAAVIEGQES